MKICIPLYGHEYLCYAGEEFLGIATFSDDPFIGDSFIRYAVHKTYGIIQEVLIPDHWTLKDTWPFENHIPQATEVEISDSLVQLIKVVNLN